MQVTVEVFEGANSVKQVELAVVEAEMIAAVLERAARELGIDHEELLVDIVVGDIDLDPNSTVGEVAHHGHRWVHRRMCVDLRFESEAAKHHFSRRSTWRRVHEWGCRKFDVPTALCANLQLHEGSPEGPVLNDRLHLGHFHGCKVVWLVKPGPEPSGR